MKRIIRENDIVKAVSRDKNGRYIATVYDSGFENISQVISTLLSKSREKVSEFWINNIDRGWYGYYYTNGRKKD